MVNELKLSVLLLGIAPVLRIIAWKDALFRAHLKKANCVVQIKLKDNSQGHIFEFASGRISARRGIRPAPDVAMIFKDAATAVSFIGLPVNHAERIHAAKNFRVVRTVGRVGTGAPCTITATACVWDAPLRTARSKTVCKNAK